MTDDKRIYKWKMKDKILYVLSLIPFIAGVVLASIIMWPICIYMVVVWLLIYFVLNIFQASCCISCPYRGKYCPAIYGIYFSNILSNFLYRDFEYDEKQFKQNAKWGEITLVIFLLYPLYWLIISDWSLALIYLGLMLLHPLIFMPTQCKNCSFNKKCPGGKMYIGLCGKRS